MCNVKFDPLLIKKARFYFNTVYVGKVTPEMILGSETDLDGDQVIIFRTSWEYEEALTFKENESLKRYIEQYENEQRVGFSDLFTEEEMIYYGLLYGNK